MKRFAAVQMNTCMTTDASACAAAPETSCASTSVNMSMDTAIMAVSIFVIIFSILRGMISLISLIIMLSFLVLSIILVWKADNSILPVAGTVR